MRVVSVSVQIVCESSVCGDRERTLKLALVAVVCVVRHGHVRVCGSGGAARSVARRRGRIVITPYVLPYIQVQRFLLTGATVLGNHYRHELNNYPKVGNMNDKIVSYITLVG
eukprot:6212360-Pleurochrysis_carterae.AAC.2